MCIRDRYQRRVHGKSKQIKKIKNIKRIQVMLLSCLKNSSMNTILKCSFASTYTHKLSQSRVCMLKPESLPTKTTVNKETMLKLFEEMTMGRKIDQKLEALYRAKEVRGFLHLQYGQEAVAVGMENAVDNKNDPMSVGYRIRTQVYCRGMPLEKMIAECLAKRDGISKGNGGSYHLYMPEAGLYGGHSIVGQQIPLAVGHAFALKYNGNPKKSVAITMYGDGAANQGQWWEGLNMASLWKLPLLCVCENNRYGFGTPIKDASSNPDFYNRGSGLLIPGFDCDGFDVLEVREKMKFAREYALKHGPIIIEAHCYRYSGHSTNDPGTTYRTREEVVEVRKTKDPIMKLEKLILGQKIATKDELKKIDKKCKDKIEAAVKIAQKARMPFLHESKELVYVDNEKHFIKGCIKEDDQYPVGESPY
eukprot:TRINITY_DN28_c0_g1_i2.p1 TRINITY_DN28_c0_g1~~TRINITY_DN28_c0_g1_i2.p1  ORF type:complete len:420 (+),score=171.78 TRINITY_DN28_c0_g1_i2:72-1331(+)